MPKIFRGTTPTPSFPTPEGSKKSNSSNQDNLGQEPERKYSPKEPYRKYQTRENQGSNKYIKGLEMFKTKHSNKNMSQPEEKSVFKQGFRRHGQSIEERALNAYREVTGKSYAEVQANRDKILEKLDMKGKKWHNKKKIEQEIAAAKKQMPYMKPWERKELGKILETKKKAFGLGSTGKKRGWF